MRIELDRLESATGQFAHMYPVGHLTLEDDRARLTGPAEVEGSIEQEGGRARLRGKVSALAELDCDRCLRPLPVTIAVNFDVEYLPGGDYERQFAELQEDDLDQSIFDGKEIDIDDLVREQVILSLPARALCREDCKGLCPVCGIDKNSKDCECESRLGDPRWAALKNLQF